MPVWEYRQVDLNDLPRKAHEVDVLNELGEQGWELVGILDNHAGHAWMVSSLANHIAYLKRPMEEPTPAAKTHRKAAASSAERK
jgi:hypothetical protein